MDRIWFVAIGLVLLVTPATFGTVVGLQHRTLTLTAAEVPADVADSPTYEVVDRETLPAGEQRVADRLAAGEPVHVERYTLAWFGAPAVSVTVTDDGIHPGTDQWPDRLDMASFFRDEDGYYDVARASRDTAVLRTLLSDHPFETFLAFTPISLAFVYVGLRPDYA